MVVAAVAASIPLRPVPVPGSGMAVPALRQNRVLATATPPTHALAAVSAMGAPALTCMDVAAVARPMPPVPVSVASTAAAAAWGASMACAFAWTTSATVRQMSKGCAVVRMPMDATTIASPAIAK